MKKICPNCKSEYEADDNERKICYPCYQIITNCRPTKRDEMVLDCDDRENGDWTLELIGCFMKEEGYRLEYWKAQGQRSYHVHIKDIPHIAELTKEQNQSYKEILIKKYIDKVIGVFGYKPEYLNKIDFGLCIPDHLIAKENELHFKYKTKKELKAVINKDNKNFCEKEIYDQVIKVNNDYKPKVKGSGITAEITKRLNIIDLAKEFGLQVDSKGFCLCPFHPDNQPSLKFYENQGRFCCFGCGQRGNIILFYALMKKYKGGIIKNGNI